MNDHLRLGGFHNLIDARAKAIRGPILGIDILAPEGDEPTPLALPDFDFELRTVRERRVSYRFAAHFHPYVSELVDRLVENSVAGLQAADTEYVEDPPGVPVLLPDGKPRPVLHEELFGLGDYMPTEVVEKPYPVKELDFSSAGAYSVYNWELFYHVPLTIGIHLSRSRRHEEAQRWFHHIFDPTSGRVGPAPQRFWQVKPFQTDPVRLIEQVLTNLVTGDDPELQRETVDCIHAWAQAPFRPHLVARFRPTAYMFKAVMAYLQNLVDWGDSLFAEDTGESVSEALQLYILAANLLGPRPQAVPRVGGGVPQTYRTLREHLREFGTALEALETEIPFAGAPLPQATAGGSLSPLRSLGSSLYFCVPPNPTLLGFWDTVADRLFKIRNSLNLQGTFRQLPLFEPPIDPTLLVRATAAGLDVAAVVAGVHQPLPLVRYGTLAQQAMELCQEVKSLGAGLLSVIEKEDAEALAVLRARHEHNTLALASAVKYTQWQEAVKNRESVERTITAAARRFTYYEQLLGVPPADIKVPGLNPLSNDDLTGLLDRAVKNDAPSGRADHQEPDMVPRDVPIDISPGGLSDTGGMHISRREFDELSNLRQAQNWQNAAGIVDAVGAAMAAIPDFHIHGHFWGLGISVKYGGTNLHHAASSLAAAGRTVAGELSYQATRAGKVAGFARREQEWAFHSATTAGEIVQSFKQLRAAQLREAAAQWEHKNHLRTVEQSADLELFLTGQRTKAGPENVAGKHTHQDYYVHMRREVRGLYTQCFQLALEAARKAERALQAELGDRDLTFLRHDYHSGPDQLLAGEKLFQDLKRMDAAHAELNRREYELTKSVSLLQLDPAQLVELRQTGSCAITLPEEVFDMDTPGHYFRRIKTVAVSLPCVTGPYTGVPCTLTLQHSSLRTSPALRDSGYARDGDGDDRFADDYGSTQSIVTSTGQHDSGMFDTNLRDERRLPFEGSGAVSAWRLELPAQFRPFDYDTIADVVLHLRFTAREGGQGLRRAAEDHLRDFVKPPAGAGPAADAAAPFVRLFSVRHEFPSAWAAFKNTPQADATPGTPLKLRIGAEHFPFWTTRGSLETTGITVYGSEAVTVTPPAGQGTAAALETPLGALHFREFPDVTVALDGTDFVLTLDNRTIKDLYLTVRWGCTMRAS